MKWKLSLTNSLAAERAVKAGFDGTNLKETEPASNNRFETAFKNHMLTQELSGTKPATLINHKYILQQLNQECDIFNSKQTVLYIIRKTRIMNKEGNPANNCQDQKDKKISSGYLKKMLNIYTAFCDNNQIPIDKPKIIYQAPVPIIPTTEQVNNIITSAHGKYVFIFTLLSQTAIEAGELHNLHKDKISKEQGIISIEGNKQHNNGSYKLKEQTTDMLRQYLAQNNEEYPFPTTHAVSLAWQYARHKAITRYCKKELKNIPMKNLRNYAGAQFYLTTGRHDPIATMRFMRHKKLETTLHYIRAINLDEPIEYETKAVQLGTNTTMKEIIELSNAGYLKFTEADGYQYYRKPK